MIVIGALTTNQCQYIRATHTAHLSCSMNVLNTSNSFDDIERDFRFRQRRLQFWSNASIPHLAFFEDNPEHDAQPARLYWTDHLDRCLAHTVRLRAILDEKSTPVATAFAMGLHERLGAASLVRSLPDTVVELIFSKSFNWQ
jgi:hypothetical protein